eukprot:COSAG02_NODE_1099_length_14585_cov_19.264669_6_plen_61_part_00
MGLLVSIGIMLAEFDAGNQDCLTEFPEAPDYPIGECQDLACHGGKTAAFHFYSRDSMSRP